MSTSIKSASKLAQLVIIGSGPAAHTAAIYASRANLNPVLFEGMLAGGIAPGGQLTTTTDVENFPGFPDGIQGQELMDNMRRQSERFNTQIRTETISKVDFRSKPFKLWVESEEKNSEPSIMAKCVIISTGAIAKRLFLPGEELFWNKGISACAVCDGAIPMFRNQHLVVIGGGDSACEEAIFLTKYASKVTVLVRRDKLRASKVMADRLINNKKVEILWNHEAKKALGSRTLEKLVIVNNRTQEEKEIEVKGLFYAIGHQPNTKEFKGQIDLHDDEYIKVTPGTCVTSVEGVFACGDVQDKKYRQAITAAGSGCMAALDAIEWLETNTDEFES